MEVTGHTRGATAEKTGVATPAASILGRWNFLFIVADVITMILVIVSARDLPAILLAIFVVSTGLLLASAGLYSSRLRMVVLDQVPVVVGVVTLSAMAVVTINFMLLALPIGPGQVLALWASAAILVPFGRLVTAPVHRVAVKSLAKRRTLIVGSGSSAVLVANKIQHHPELGLDVIGFVDNGPRKAVRGRHEPLLGDLDSLAQILVDSKAEVAILAFVKNNYQDILRALYHAEPQVEIMMMPRYFEFLSAGIRVDDLAGMPLLAFGNGNGHSLVQRGAKRLLDIVVASLAILIVLPFVPLIALAIKLNSPGPIFYKGRRVGREGKVFDVYKFRSMSLGAERETASHDRPREASTLGLKAAGLPCVTRVGRILRRTSIDELPQLLNVLTGDMSLVGPRPPLPSEFAEYYEWQKKRMSVRPGITGIWQVSGRSELPFDERVWLDFMYIDTWSLWLDFRILLQTVGAVISMRGAY